MKVEVKVKVNSDPYRECKRAEGRGKREGGKGKREKGKGKREKKRDTDIDTNTDTVLANTPRMLTNGMVLKECTNRFEGLEDTVLRTPYVPYRTVPPPLSSERLKKG